MKAFGRIAESTLPLDMAPVLDRLLSELTSYLRKSNRLLRQAALAAIEVCSPPCAARPQLWLEHILRLSHRAGLTQAPCMESCYVYTEQDASLSSLFQMWCVAARLNAGCIAARRL